MKKNIMIILSLLSLNSTYVFANAYEDSFKNTIATQATANDFIKNYEITLTELEKKIENWQAKPDESPEVWFPICVGYENMVTILKNNEKYKKQFNESSFAAAMNFDETVENYKTEVEHATDLCQKAKKALH